MGRRAKTTVTVLVLALVAPALSASAADLAAGKDLFAKKCAGCHGADGKGNAKMEAALKVKLPDLTASKLSDADLATLLAEGKKPMPGFKSLDKDSLDAVAAYTKSLSGK